MQGLDYIVWKNGISLTKHLVKRGLAKGNEK